MAMVKASECDSFRATCKNKILRILSCFFFVDGEWKSWCENKERSKRNKTKKSIKCVRVRKIKSAKELQITRKIFSGLFSFFLPVEEEKFMS